MTAYLAVLTLGVGVWAGWTACGIVSKLREASDADPFNMIDLRDLDDEEMLARRFPCGCPGCKAAR